MCLKPLGAEPAGPLDAGLAGRLAPPGTAGFLVALAAGVSDPITPVWAVAATAGFDLLSSGRGALEICGRRADTEPGSAETGRSNDFDPLVRCDCGLDTVFVAAGCSTSMDLFCWFRGARLAGRVVAVRLVADDDV